MTTRTGNLDLPLVAAAQAQKHVTVNEALLTLDSAVHLAAVAAVTEPPSAAAVGDRYLVTNGTGMFAGQDRRVAVLEDGGWRFLEPREGWMCWLRAERRVLVYFQSAWIDAPVRAADLLGVNASADANNRLSVASPAVLLSHAGADMRLKINKSAAAATCSVLFQSGWAGRAEIGLCGNDQLRLKVSSDGAAWKDALVVDNATGAVSFPFGIAAGECVAFRNRLRNPSFTINQRAVSSAVTLAAGAYGHDGVKAGAAGVAYSFAANGADVAITILSGSLILPVEADLIQAGDYVLAHDGSAQARVWQGSGSGSGAYAAAARSSGGLTCALSGATQTNVEFSAGVVLRPQLETGRVATAFERLPPDIALIRNRRYFQRKMLLPVQFGVAGWWINNISLSPSMRVAPTATPFGAPSYSNAGNGTINSTSPDMIAFQMQTGANGGYVMGYWVDLSAEL